MSNDKEFKEWYYVGEKCDTRFDNLESQNAYYKCLETWNCQQKIIDKQNKEIERYREVLKEVSKYETCWTCKYYLGGTDKYCNPPSPCGTGRTQFVPNERSKQLALEALSEVKNG